MQLSVINNNSFNKIIARGKLIDFTSFDRGLYTNAFINSHFDHVIHDSDAVARLIKEVPVRNARGNPLELKESYRLTAIRSPFRASKWRMKFHRLMRHINMPFSESFHQALDIDRNKIVHYVDSEMNASEIKKVFEEIEVRKRLIMSIVDRYEFKEIARRFDEDIILQVDTFYKEYFYQLPQNVKGFVCKNIVDQQLVQIMANAYGVQVSKTAIKIENNTNVILDPISNLIYVNPTEIAIDLINQSEIYLKPNYDEKPTFIGDKVKFYCDIADTRNLALYAKNNWYNGGVIYRSEYLFISKGFYPTYDEIKDTLTSVVEAFEDKEVIIQIPDLNEVKYIWYDESDVYPYEIDIKCIFLNMFEAIFEVAKNTSKHINVIIPMLREGKEVNLWKFNLPYIYSKYDFKDVEEILTFGYKMETETAFMYPHDYEEMPMAVIGLDNFIEEVMEVSRFKEIEFNDFLYELWEDLYDTRQHLQRRMLRTWFLVEGVILGDLDHITKFINRSYRHIVMHPHLLNVAAQALKQKESRRGLYKGRYKKYYKEKMMLLKEERDSLKKLKKKKKNNKKS